MLYTFKELLERPDLQQGIGQKAASLLRLIAGGLPVPPGACLTSSALDTFMAFNELEPLLQAALRSQSPQPEALRQAILTGLMPPGLQEELEAFQLAYPDTPLAVRSSGLQEDLQGASFAGLYTTRLNVIGETELMEAIRSCWASLYHPRVLQYCRDKHLPLDQLGLGVILQEMIPAGQSGVLFSVNPLKGRDTEMLIEACHGLGEALVSGEITPERYEYDWYRQTETARQSGTQDFALVAIPEAPWVRKEPLAPAQIGQAVLNQSEVRSLAELAVSVQQQEGFPVDIEWVRHQDTFYIVQSRPITVIHYQAIPGEWTTADFRDGGVSSSVCSTLMWSLYDFVWEVTMPTYLERTRLIDRDQGIDWANLFFGRPYWNVGAVKDGLKRLPGFVERSFDEDLGIHATYQGQGYVTPTTLRTIWTGLQVLGALKISFCEQLLYCREFAPRQRQRLEELERCQIENLAPPDFLRFYEKFIREDYFLSESSYFYLIYDNSNVATLFKESFAKLNDINYLYLISGLTDLAHLRLNYRLWDVSRALREPETLAYWRDTPVSKLVRDWRASFREHGMDRVRDLIADFGFHATRELDITVPRFHEDPSFIIESLKNNLELDNTAAPRLHNQRQHERFLVEKQKLLGTVPTRARRQWERRLAQLRDFLWWREELRDLSTRYYAQVRRLSLRLGEHLVQLEGLEQREDIFHLSLQDLFAFFQQEATPAELCRRARINAIYYQSWRHFQNPNEIGSRYQSQPAEIQTGAAVLKGVPCSPGLVTGRARVIADIFDADRLQPGDILITPFTDPGWTPKFGLLSGVATETGGLLSHAAVIAREYGIPAILAVPNLTRLVREGQTITLDGNLGQIRLDALP